MAFAAQSLSTSPLSNLQLGQFRTGPLFGDRSGKHSPVVALAFGGYAPKNIGRTGELLANPLYATILKRFLRAGADVCSDALHKHVDLIARAAQGDDLGLADYGEAIAFIVSTQLAQLQILRDVYGIDCRHTRFSFGYSLGEVTALIHSGVFTIDEVLPPLLCLADECAAMADGLSVALLIFRGPAQLTDTESLCLSISREGRGEIAVSAHLSPNTLLLIGQNSTLDVFAARMPSAIGRTARLRKLQDRWPPLHTHLMRQRGIAGKVAEKLTAASGGKIVPTPPVLSLVTGKFSYRPDNSRQMLVSWVEQPQRLSAAICRALALGVERIIHVGPRPEPIRTAWARIASAVEERGDTVFSAGALGRLARHPWLARLPFSRTSFLRAGSVSHVVLEDWLLDNHPAHASAKAGPTMAGLRSSG